MRQNVVKLKEKKLLLYLKFLYVSTLPILIIVGNNTGGILGTLYDLKGDKYPKLPQNTPRKKTAVLVMK